jgi:hypothetical protein
VRIAFDDAIHDPLELAARRTVECGGRTHVPARVS